MRGRSQKTEVLSTPLERGALKGLNSGSLIEFDCGEPPSKEAATHKKDVTLIVMREAFEKLLVAGHGWLWPAMAGHGYSLCWPWLAMIGPG